jgi:death-on-curing protein
VRNLTIAEALTITEAVTGTPAAVLARASRLDLLDSALHAPQAGFGEVEFHPDFADKAAELTVRITKNHPLPDGNKRLAWQSLTMFCILNGYRLEVPTDAAVDLMLAIAAGDQRDRGRHLAGGTPPASRQRITLRPTRDIAHPRPSRSGNRRCRHRRGESTGQRLVNGPLTGPAGE